MSKATVMIVPTRAVLQWQRMQAKAKRTSMFLVPPDWC